MKLSDDEKTMLLSDYEKDERPHRPVDISFWVEVLLWLTSLFFMGKALVLWLKR